MEFCFECYCKLCFYEAFHDIRLFYISNVKIYYIVAPYIKVASLPIRFAKTKIGNKLKKRILLSALYTTAIKGDHNRSRPLRQEWGKEY